MKKSIINISHLIRLNERILKFHGEIDFLFFLLMELIGFGFLLYILINYRIELFS
jgi:hypothetical protein